MKTREWDGARLKWLTLLLSCMTLAGGCGLGTTARRDHIFAYLKTSRGNAAISEIEHDLRLGRPVEIINPQFVDPLWWFVYRIGDQELALAANWDSEMASGDPRSHDFYFWANLWTIENANEEESLQKRLVQQPFDLLQLYYGGSDASAYSDYLRKLDKRVGVPISKMESDLHLPAPVDIEVPAFIMPIWEIIYDVNGYHVHVWATYTNGYDSEKLAQDQRSKLVFAGYWKVIRLDSKED